MESTEVTQVHLEKDKTDEQLQDSAALHEDVDVVVDKMQDVRIATIGNVDSGKSTLISVLCNATNDDGRGSARSMVLRHRHEQVHLQRMLLLYIYLTLNIHAVLH
jgi:GTPase